MPRGGKRWRVVSEVQIGSPHTDFLPREGITECSSSIGEKFKAVFKKTRSHQSSDGYERSNKF